MAPEKSFQQNFLVVPLSPGAGGGVVHTPPLSWKDSEGRVSLPPPTTLWAVGPSGPGHWGGKHTGVITIATGIIQLVPSRAPGTMLSF